MTNKIQIKRSTAATGPGTVLHAGELAYSYVSNKLFVGSSGGVGNPAHIIFGGNTGDINFVGITAGAGLTGTKLTPTGDHTQTLAIDKTASIHMGGISCDGGFTLASGASVSGIGVGDLDDVASGIISSNMILAMDAPNWTPISRGSWLAPVTVSSFNGSTGAVTGVASFNGSTGAVTFNSNVTSFNGSTGAVTGVSSFNGSTGALTGVSSFNGSTGAVDVTSSQTLIGGVTLGGGGVTFSNKLGLTGSSFIMFPDGTTQDQGAITKYAAAGSNVVDVNSAGNYSNILDISSNDFTCTVTSGQSTVGAEHAVQYTLSAGSNIAKLNGSSQTWTGVLGNVFTTPIGSPFYAAGTVTEVFKSIADSSATHMGVTAGEISFKVSGTDILKLDTDIHAKVGISADVGATFGGDVHFGGNLILPEDGEVQIGGDTEKIIFNGGSAIINLIAGQVSVGSGGGNGYIQSYGDNDTNMRYQADQWTLKVGGTDYIDVTTAGTNFADTDVVRPNLKDYSETVNEIGTITGDTAVSFADGNVQTVTGNGDCLFTFTNPPASGKSGTLTIIITNGGANTTTWHSSVKWPGDNAPALTSSGVDVISLMTIDAGTTIYGFVGGINFS